MGETIQVKVIAVDDQDRVKLSRKQALRELGRRARQQMSARRGERTAESRKGMATVLSSHIAQGRSGPTRLQRE